MRIPLKLLIISFLVLSVSIRRRLRVSCHKSRHPRPPFPYFKQLVNEHPKSFLVPAANLAIAKCYVAEGKYKEAETLLKRDLLYNRDHYAALPAQMELINVLNAMGEYDAALNEIQLLEQVGGKSFYASAYSGLKEKLMRVTGVTTNLQQQAYENKSL